MRGRFLLLGDTGSVIPSLVAPVPVVLMAADEYWIVLKDFFVLFSISTSLFLLAILPSFRASFPRFCASLLYRFLLLMLFGFMTTLYNSNFVCHLFVFSLLR